MADFPIIWIIILFLFMQPVLQRRWMQMMRARKIAQLQARRKSRVILIVHRQEQVAFFGIPLIRFITMNDAEEVMRALSLTDAKMPVDIVLHTPGGLVLAATQIAQAINRREGKVRVIIPHYAMSGGTLIALAADEIIMSDHAVMGPLDPQLGGYPAPELIDLKRRKSYDEIGDQMMIMSEMAAKAVDQIEHTVAELLCRTQDEATAKQVAKLLSEGTWTHDYPITPAVARDILKLNVSTEMPKDVLEMMALYRQPGQQGGVEYLPGRREAGGDMRPASHGDIRFP